MIDRAMWIFPLIFLLALGSPGLAGNIYIWTDADGVKHYSDQQPPEDVHHYDVHHYDAQQGQAPTDNGHAQQAFDEMIQKVERENRQADQEQQKNKLQEQQARQKRMQEQQQALIHAARQQLQDKIDALNRRALSPTFTQGMRQAQIDKILKEMEKLQPTDTKGK